MEEKGIKWNKESNRKKDWHKLEVMLIKQGYREEGKEVGGFNIPPENNSLNYSFLGTPLA
tara:strand:- start:69 stop:248 length:180 start_codon:yes stop_codon:yes gene_type:complete